MTYDEAESLLKTHGQAHVLRFWDELGSNRRRSLLEQINGIDFDAVAHMREMLDSPAAAEDAAQAGVEPASVVELVGDEADRARSEGEAALRAGEVGVVLVAGGQGSRLGFDGPKGSYPIGPVSSASLFCVHARKILALERKFDTRVPFYIMTSTANDEATRAFFHDNAFFGLCPERVRFFVQGMWPALRSDGTLLLDRPEHVFVSPDGHGGTLAALKKNGILDDMAARGLKTVFYFQVDNPLIEIAAPAFIGAHRLGECDMSLKVCAKRNPSEGLGVVARRQGCSIIVEYTELTEEQRNARLPDGKLKFLYGSVAIHVFSVDFLRRVAEERLPLHLARKKVPYCDEQGNTVKPDEPNACKFEKFIFDALPFAERVLNVVFDREDEFAPVKNASGNDSPDTARLGMIRKSARMLEACGVNVPSDAAGIPIHRIEIDPCYALTADELRQKLPSDFSLEGDVFLKEK